MKDTPREQQAAQSAAELGLQTPTFQSLPEMHIAGINCHYTMQTRSAIPKQWQTFVARIDRIPGCKGPVSYGISWNPTPTGEFDYLTGVEVSSGDGLGDLTVLKLESRRYAVFAHLEPSSVIPKTLETIWKSWVPICGLAIGKGCIERYTSEYNPQTGMGGTEIRIPLET